MPGRILVAYATRYGSTQEVAEAVGATMKDSGLEVDVRPMREVRSLDHYRAVVMGAALYIGHWHKDAQDFLSRHRAALTGLPVAVFALGPMHNEAKEFEDARKQLDAELAKVPGLVPVAIEIFGGKFDPETLKFPWSMIPALKMMPASDIRDWTAIRAWASSLPAALQPTRE